MDLNTTHNIFQVALRGIQQIQYHQKQLNCLELIEEAYKLPTAETFGHLRIDSDPKTNQGLRFLSQLFAPDSSILFSSDEVLTTVVNENETLAYANSMGK